jgi:hypothetical protein
VRGKLSVMTASNTNRDKVEQIKREADAEREQARKETEAAREYAETELEEARERARQDR